MRRIAFGVASGVFALALLVPAAHAQVDDHLKCYKVKGPIKLKGIVDLGPGGGAFEA